MRRIERAPRIETLSVACMFSASRCWVFVGAVSILSFIGCGAPDSELEAAPSEVEAVDQAGDEVGDEADDSLDDGTDAPDLPADNGGDGASEASDLPSLTTAAADNGKRLVAVTDHASDQIRLFDPTVADWSKGKGEEWKWKPTAANGVPNDNVAVAASVGNFARVYASSQGKAAKKYAQFARSSAEVPSR